MLGSACSPTGPVESEVSGPAAPTPTSGVAEQRALIERKIREQLGAPAHTALGPRELAGLTELDLKNTPIDDSGVAWLAEPATGLSALTTLNLQHTSVSDRGIALLARPDSGLTQLRMLFLAGTQVGDDVEYGADAHAVATSVRSDAFYAASGFSIRST